MAKKIGLGVLIAVVLFLGFVAMQPGQFRVSRTASIAAPPAAVYAQLADFHKWADWSPWEKLDPAMKKSFSGADAAPGATYAWVGNDKVGEGRMTLVSAAPPNELTIQLEFIKPFASTSTTVFQLARKGAATEVVWAMEGKNNFVAKAFCLFMDMDKMVGTDFEKGLAQLKTVAEATPAPIAIPAVAH